MHALPEALLAAIRDGFAPDFLALEPSELETYGGDWTQEHPRAPSAVAFPQSTAEVSQFLALCSKHKIAVVPSGGRTGLAGGAVAAKGEIVLSLKRMSAMGEVDTMANTVRVEAGAITEAVHKHCEPHGLTWPVDFASKGSSTVGGNISTNAGGVKVIHYGLTRQWVLGLTVVTMAGEVLELNGALEKNNTGLDLRQLFIGSEGTLGVVTGATLKLAHLPRALDVFFFAVDGIPEVLNLFHEARRAPFQLFAFECLTHPSLEAVTANLGVKSPFHESYGSYVLLEFERPAGDRAQTALDAWLQTLFDRGLVRDGTLAQSPREAADLWRLREGIAESIMRKGICHKNDVAVPVAALEAFIGEMNELFETRHSDLAMYLFGHIGDGNLHINTMKPDSMKHEEFSAQCHKADEDLFQLVKKHRGSVSAEHGIGLLKKDALRFSRTPEELAIMKSVKKSLDPEGLLNPGKIFD